MHLRSPSGCGRNRNKCRKVCSIVVHAYYKSVHYFAYIIGFDAHLLQIQIVVKQITVAVMLHRV